MRKICIFETGGTIGAVKPLMKKISLEDTKTILIPMMSKDSNNIGPRDWVEMAYTIVEACRNDFDGIVLTHGTDTLAFTAIALSFIIRNLNIPVAVTGSMIPGNFENSDAINNLRSAIMIASESDIAEVCIIFSASESGSEAAVIRGTRGRKVSTKKINAFRSINAPTLGYVGKDGVRLKERLISRRRSSTDPYLTAGLETNVALVKIHPALGAGGLRQMLGWAKAAVIEAFGAGQIRTDDGEILDIMSGFTGPIALTSQCHEDGVDLHPESVEPDRIALSIPRLIPLKDMLPEAALIKMMWVLGNGWNPYELMAKNVSGEIASFDESTIIDTSLHHNRTSN